MDKYEVIGLLGEGSFGRVYKAKRNEDGLFVALKVISKRGRSTKELKGLRRECEIQRYLHHPNIIQMLDSFETDNEIVVIAEFAEKELNYILGKEGYLHEDRVQRIVWDLVSALYYLHSHRVLHRDLKPQNILMDANNTAKLCDFGFARNMSTGTHVLTSIKGTPLYMAPELIEEQPYDHNADLWSLGCIIYELLVGAPPFCTASILHLIRLIKHEQVQWPTFLSDDCISFLRGLLQKNPSNRMTWPEILSHPFVKGNIIIMENTPIMPLTRPMTPSTLEMRENQRICHINQKSKQLNMKTLNIFDESVTVGTTTGGNKPMISGYNEKSLISETNKGNYPPTLLDPNQRCSELNVKDIISSLAKPCPASPVLTKAEPLDFHENTQPIENEEWVGFLYKIIDEIMNEQIECILQPGSINILLTPLRNSRANPKVVGLVASLFSLPFVAIATSSTIRKHILQVYLEIKLVPNLIYASKLLLRMDNSSQECENLSIEFQEKLIDHLSNAELQCVEHVYLLISHLIYIDSRYVSQFCDSVIILNLQRIINGLLQLRKRKIKIVTDILAILTHVMHSNPENNEVIQKILQSNQSESEVLDFVAMLRSNDALLRERTCNFLLQVAKIIPRSLQRFWGQKIRDTLEALKYDSLENVRNAAEMVVCELKPYDFYAN